MQTVVTMREAKAAETAQAHPSTHAPAHSPAHSPTTARATEPVAAAAPVRSAFLPLLLGLTALLGALAHQAWQLDQERRQLQAAQDGTAPRLEAASQLRRSLDLLAADTQRLADGGNAPARALVEELRRRGITINATATATGGGTAAAAAPAASR